MRLDGNRFTNNSVTASGTNSVNGGALFVATGIRGITTPALTLNQTGNLFRGNSVTGTGGSYAGGGEFTTGADLTSTGDAYINNALPGPSVSGRSSEGGGLGDIRRGAVHQPRGRDVECDQPRRRRQHDRRPERDRHRGRGRRRRRVRRLRVNGGAYHMSLINSTISGNAATGAPANAVAGIDGESIDFLGMDNTILAGDSGGAEIGGFGASPGQHVTAEGSDVCDVGSIDDAVRGVSQHLCGTVARRSDAR